jgi:hypothetical protein
MDLTTHRITRPRRPRTGPERVPAERLGKVGNVRMQLEGTSTRRWSCDCQYFRAHSFCAHTLAMESSEGGLL